MKLVIISDSHGRHEDLGRLRGDLLIHCGDSGNGFTRHADDVDRLDTWFGQQRFDRILCIGGNHDFEIQARAERGGPVFRNAEYLQDQAYEYRGVRFYGSPWTPELVNWAFYLDDDELRDRWELIPDEVEVLITHTPPFGILDRNSSGRNCGCRELQRRLLDLHPRIHCFGHIHASAGTTSMNGTTFVNASMVNRRYEIARRSGGARCLGSECHYCIHP